MWLRRSLPLAAPTRWQHAVSKLSSDKILPSPDQKFAAFVGDKILGATVAALLRNSKETHDHSSAARLVGMILSNKFFADRIDTILPGKVYRDAAESVSEHSAGTMVEAAVAAASDAEAVDDLVKWLIEEARDLDIVNAKGRLLELGGTVSSSRIGGSDHLPVFRAIAVLEGATEEAEGNTKKDAEQRAARKYLENLGYVTSTASGGPDTLNIDLPLSLNQWRPVLGETMNLKLTDGETMSEWWKRGATDRKSAFRRALLAPLVFPDNIEAVDSWIRRSESDGQNSAFLVITVLYSKDGVSSCWSSTAVAASGSLAKSELGMEANRHIAAVVSVHLPETTDG